MISFFIKEKGGRRKGEGGREWEVGVSGGGRGTTIAIVATKVVGGGGGGRGKEKRDEWRGRRRVGGKLTTI